MLISSRSKQLPLFAPALPEPAPRINNTTPMPPSSTLQRPALVSRAEGSQASAETLESRVRRCLAVQANPLLAQAA